MITNPKTTTTITAIAAAATMFLCMGMASAAEVNRPVLDKNAMPFLITGKLPHLTAMLMTQWDNPRLGLTDQQKRWLKVVREETIADVKRLASEVSTLENQVVEGINSGLEPDDLYATVKEIASLKTEATMVHLKCIYDTRKILKPEQMKFLLDSGKTSN